MNKSDIEKLLCEFNKIELFEEYNGSKVLSKNAVILLNEIYNSYYPYPSVKDNEKKEIILKNLNILSEKNYEQYLKEWKNKKDKNSDRTNIFFIPKGFETNELDTTFINKKKIPIPIPVHEEIVYLLRPNYCIPTKTWLKLLQAAKIKWHVNGESHKSPDLIFEYKDKKIGVEVTRAKIPNVISNVTEKQFSQIIKKEKVMETSQYDAAIKAIENKNRKIENYIKCDEYILIILINPLINPIREEDDDSGECSTKMFLQIKIWDYLKENPTKFKDVLIA
ncbi:hypothetical protein [Spiroplasma endosymbiont of Amphibalanus improvisus]|uniref:hypothetical protein n=1 Tax=Spiroplasma endosymbiont of Amphibalanus improvisus TaxID=3066327 RepID=UPI00313D1079